MDKIWITFGKVWSVGWQGLSGLTFLVIFCNYMECIVRQNLVLFLLRLGYSSSLWRFIFFLHLHNTQSNGEKLLICRICIGRFWLGRGLFDPGLPTDSTNLNFAVSPQWHTAEEMWKLFPLRTSVGVHHSHSNVVDGPLLKYQSLLDAGKIRKDPHQLFALQKLQSLHERIKHYEPSQHVAPKPSVLPFANKVLISCIITHIYVSFEICLPRRNPTYHSSNHRKEFTCMVMLVTNISLFRLHLIGSGKTFLMDLFYQTSTITKKRRVHFHSFMLDVHHSNIFTFSYFLGIHLLRQQLHRDDPIPPLAKQLTDEAWLICFDEFQVTDVADATILHRLFSNMFKNGTVMVATSNRPPKGVTWVKVVVIMKFLIKCWRLSGSFLWFCWDKAMLCLN